MNPEEPIVTLGVPVYNGEAFVAEALESLLAQTYRNFEIVISDNASTDRTAAICQEFAARDSRIRYVRQKENRGSVNNFNCLVALARGRYFKWAASDDICCPTYLESVVAVLEAEPDIVWCHSESGKIDEHGKVLSVSDPAAEGLAHTREAGFPRQDHDSDQRHRRFRGILLGTSWCADAYAVIRKSALEKTYLLPHCYGSEKVLMGELGLMGCYKEVPETLFYQRVHSNASGSLQNKEQQAAFALASPKKKKRFSATRLALLKGHFNAVNHVPMSFADRLRCYGVILQYLLQSSKWKKILRDDLQGRPLGKYMAESRVRHADSNN
jgi:glycosyltransferase involved in cell wall biosynthesis